MRQPEGVSNEERGQSEVLGFVLLIGIVGIGSVAILLAAGATTDGVQSQAEIDRVEGAFVQLSTDVATASSTTDTGSSTEFSIDASEGTVRKTDGGNMTVHIEGHGEVANESLGAIEYTNDDGSVIAYEGGGVWRGTGDRSIPVSGPPITYNDGTLTLPVFNVTGGSASGSGVAVSDVRTNSSFSGPTGDLDDSQNLRINVTTAYHNGWAEYFRSMGNTSVATHGTGEYRTVEAIVGLKDVPEEIEDVSLSVDPDSVISASSGTVSTSTASNSYTSGDIVTPADVHVNHQFDGNVLSGGSVVLDDEGTGTGEIVARNGVHVTGGTEVDTILAGGDVTIEGHVEDNVVSYGDIRIQDGASYGGDLVATGSIIDDGDCTGDCTLQESVPSDEIGPHPEDELEDLPEHEPIDGAYDHILDQGEGEEIGHLSGGDRVEAGQYFADGIGVSSGTLELDVSDGDIDIVVPPGGNVDMSGDIRVTGTAGNDNKARILTSGTVSMSGNAEICPASMDESCSDLPNSERQAGPLQIFGTTGSSFSFNGGGTFHGSIYAPQDEVSADAVDAEGTLDFYGSFIVGGLDASGTVTFERSDSGPSSPTGNWDGHLEGIETDEEAVYVHVRSHEIVLEDT